MSELGIFVSIIKYQYCGLT